jgi:hypothetical protein
MLHGFDSADPKFKSQDAPPSAPLLSTGVAASIGVGRSRLASALAPSRPHNRRERLAGKKRLRELRARTK